MWLASQTDIKKISTHKKVIRCDGLLNDLLWRISVSVLIWELWKIWLPWLLIQNENQWNVQCHRVGDRYFVLNSHYSFACLVLSIVSVSQKINWLSCQIFRISKCSSSRFRKRWENFVSQIWKFSKKNNFLTTPPLEWFGPRPAPWKFVKNQIPNSFWWFLW